MKCRMAVGVLLLGSLAQTKDHKPYQSGTLLEMDSIACGYDEKGGKIFAGEILETDSDHKTRNCSALSICSKPIA